MRSMKRIIAPALFALLLAAAPAAAAFDKVEMTTETFTEEFLLKNIPDFVSTPEGGTDWQLFGATKSVEYTEKDPQGYDRTGVRPVFPDGLKPLDGKQIKIRGFMFPMDQSEEQKVFLLGPFPLTCPYHYHVANNLIIEVQAQKPVTFSYDAVTLEGRLELVPKDDQYNTFYRLHDAAIAR